LVFSGFRPYRSDKGGPTRRTDSLSPTVSDPSALNASRPREYCGVFGVFGDARAAERAYFGLYALQHRGQESAGIATSDGRHLHVRRGMGLVSQVFTAADVEARLPGRSAIGHNRYSTTGTSDLVNAQPIAVQFKRGEIAAAHNGNLVNVARLRREMEEAGSIFQTTTDSEVVVHLIARSQADTVDRMVVDALGQVEGAYSFVFLTPDALIAARDPQGFRPLCLGRLGDAIVVASESCALDIMRAHYVRSIEPGEVLVADGDGLRSELLPAAPRRAQCIFEFIYFSRPDSWVFGEKVDKIRRRLGRLLAQEHPCPEAEIVIAVPDSANTAALGYAEESGVRFEIGLIRNHYVGRTFIDPSQPKRDRDVRVKFNPVAGVLRDKRVVVIEDSIVRGTTLRNLVRLIRSGGAAEVHVRVSSPPLLSPCYFGIDMSKKAELIAANHSVDEIRQFVGADSLEYLSVGKLREAVDDPENYCFGCFTTEYPAPVPEGFDKEMFGAGGRRWAAGGGDE
jgi:amidophosphoribosyltransferase